VRVTGKPSVVVAPSQKSYHWHRQPRWPRRVLQSFNWKSYQGKMQKRAKNISRSLRWFIGL